MTVRKSPTTIVMACATPAETQALTRRAEAAHARLRSGRRDAGQGVDRAAFAALLSAAEQALREWEAIRTRQAVFRRIVDAGWLLDDQAFARRQAERRRESRAAADRGDVEFFRRLD